MEFGISMFGDLAQDNATGKRKPAEQRLQELIKEIQLADEAGLDVFGVGEHHREDYAVSNPEIVLAAAATVTRRIKLGSAVTVLSSADPIRIYQHFAMIDLLSGGRAELMVGRGSFTESFPLFGYELQDYDMLFEEKLSLLLAVNEQERVNWSGEFRKPLADSSPVLPRAVHNQLPIWIAVGGTPQSVQRAARLGLPLMVAIIGGNPASFRPLVEYYHEEYLRNGHDPAKMQIGVHAHSFIGADGKATGDMLYPYYAAQMDRIGRDRGWPPYSRNQFESGRNRHGALFIGEPAALADKILEWKEMFGLTRFVAHMDVGGAPHTDMMKSIELFAKEVAETVRRADVK